MAPRDFNIDTATAETAEAPTLCLPEKITLPLPPSKEREAKFEMEIYARFMRHLRQVPNSRMEIKILSSIQFTADMIDVSDALVAKVLCDLGLRAPRKAFPLSFLEFADKTLQRQVWGQETPPASVTALKAHWDMIGEDRFSTVVPSQGTQCKEFHPEI